MKKIIYIIFLLLFIQLAQAGVSHPNRLTLAPGDEGIFSFAVDAVQSPTPLLCKIEYEPQTELKIKFDKLETRVEPGKRVFMKGEVKVPRDLAFSSYKETFCVSCDRIAEIQGASTRPRFCDIPIRVDVQDIPKTEKPLDTSTILTTALVILNLVLLISVVIIFKKRRNKID